MKYILSNRYVLRGWKNIPFSLYDTQLRRPLLLSLQGFSLLEACDGICELQSSSELEKYCKMGVIHPATDGEELLPDQKYHDYGIPLFKGVSFSPTARCNYNCRHCFMAKDENPGAAQLTREQCMALFNQLTHDCGVAEIRFTGGEPFLHPDFADIVCDAWERGLYVREILTNGSLLHEDFLKMMRSKGMQPLMMISFDGVNRHDWLRGVPGAEKRALDALHMCASYGFPTSSHVCVHRKNVDVLRETALALDANGVEVMRVIRVSEAPRWMKTSSEFNMPPREYFDAISDFLQWYVNSECKMMLELWGMLRFYPKEGVVEWLVSHGKSDERRCKEAICTSSRSVLQIAADGDIYPCNIVSGAMRAYHHRARNVLQEPLRDILNDENWMHANYPILSEYFEHNPECATCEYRMDCQGGCRAIGYALTGSMLGKDEMRCEYYKGGYAERMRTIIEQRLTKETAVLSHNL